MNLRVRGQSVVLPGTGSQRNERGGEMLDWHVFLKALCKCLFMMGFFCILQLWRTFFLKTEHVSACGCHGNNGQTSAGDCLAGLLGSHCWSSCPMAYQTLLSASFSFLVILLLFSFSPLHILIDRTNLPGSGRPIHVRQRPRDVRDWLLGVRKGNISRVAHCPSHA